MFEAIDNTTKIQTHETISRTLVPQKKEIVNIKEQLPKKEGVNSTEQLPKNVQKTQKGIKEGSQVSKALLDDLEQDFKMIHNVGLQFSLHEATGRTMVKVINKDTDDLIREIPPEEILDLAAKLDEMVGVLFDHAA